MNTRHWLVTGVAASLLLASPLSVLSHGKAKGIVLERHNVMSDIGDSMKAMGNMMRGKAPLVRSELEGHADIVGKSAARIDELFPDTKQSRTGPGSSATPKLWNEKERFDAIAAQLVAEARKLSKMAAALGEAELKVQFREVAATCKSCHKDYRKKKKKH